MLATRSVKNEERAVQLECFSNSLWGWRRQGRF